MLNSLVLMLALAVSLILFVLAIDVIILSRFYRKSQNTVNNVAKMKYVLLGAVFVMIIVLILLAFMIDHPDVVRQIYYHACNITSSQ